MACANTATTSPKKIRIFSVDSREYCYILPGTWILKLPDELSDEEATPLNCGVATMASVTEAAEIALGDAVVVQGLGLLGLYGCAMAKARGARMRDRARRRAGSARNREEIRRRSHLQHRGHAGQGSRRRRSRGCASRTAPTP